MRALALIALLLPLTAEAGMLGGGKGLVRARTSPTAARYEFNVTGGDWPVPANAPAPIVDCRMGSYDWFNGTLDCGATDFTSSGMTNTVKEAPAVESDTLALWHLDEDSGSSLADAKGSFALTAGTGVVAIAGQIDDARDMPGTAAATGAGSAAAVTALLGSWTVEAWVKPATLPNDENGVVVYGGTSAAEADNHLLGLYVTSDGRVCSSWDTGTRVHAYACTTATIPTGAWSFLAITKVLSGGTHTTTIHIGSAAGVFTSQTFTGLANATGGGSASWHIGGHLEPGETEWFDGIVDEVRVSTTAHTAQAVEIAYRDQLGVAHRFDNRVATYWRPGGGSVGGAGVLFDGVDDYLDAGDVGDQEGDFTVCARFVTDTVAGAGYIISKDNRASARSWVLMRSGNAILFVVLKNNTTNSLITSGGVVAIGQSNVVCASYDYVADGTSVLRMNSSGVAVADVTNGVGPPQDVAATLRLGQTADGDASYRFQGSLSRAGLWSGWAASAADLARMVRSQYAAQGSLGEPLTVTRASSKSCSIGGAWFQVPSNTPCIGDAGLSVEGSRTQYALNNCSAPADQTVTLAAGVHTLWLEGTGTVAAAAGTATATGLPCTATSASACSFTVTVGGTVTLDVDGTVDRMQVENGARSSLICATTTPVTRAADVVSGAHGIASGDWTVRWVGSQPWADAASAEYALFSIGPDASSTAGDVFVRYDTSTDTIGLRIYSAAGVYKQFNTAPLVLSGQHSITATYSANSHTASFTIDGVTYATASEIGTGVATPAVAVGISIGSRAGGTMLGGGSISAVTTCNTSVASECQ